MNWREAGSGWRVAKGITAIPYSQLRPFHFALLIRCLICLFSFLFLVLAPLSSAFAQTCAEQPYTLETPQGIAGGGNLEYQGDVALFSDGGCLQTQGITIKAPELRFDQASGVLQIENLEGSTPRFRFWAAKGRVDGEVLWVEGIRVTTCRCGDELRLLSENLRFDTKTGDILLEQSNLQLWGISLLSLERLDTNINQNLLNNPTLSTATSDFASLVPIRFSLDNGVNVGLENFGLPLNRPANQPPVQLTLLGSNLGTSFPSFKFGLAAQSGNKRGAFAIEGNNSSSLVQTPNVLFTHDTKESRYGFRVSQTEQLGNFSLTGFGQLARDKAEQGLAYGTELRHAIEAREQGFGFRLESFASLVGYDQPQFYLAYGGRIAGRYDGEYSLEIAYNWTVDSRPARFWLEQREATQRFSLTLAQGLSSFGLEYDALKFTSNAFARSSTRNVYGELWADARLRYNTGQWERQELIVGFIPNALTCTDSLSVAPTVGYDFLRQAVSRFGLELRYADCCFIWRIGYQEIRIPQPGANESSAGRWVFGVELR